MKKLILGLLMLAGTTATFANTANKTSTTNNSLELTSNMKLVTPGQESTLDAALRIYDLGICDVYVNGVYVGTYHVYIVTP